MALLHSFWWEEGARAFGAAAATRALAVGTVAQGLELKRVAANDALVTDYNRVAMEARLPGGGRAGRGGDHGQRGRVCCAMQPRFLCLVALTAILTAGAPPPPANSGTVRLTWTPTTPRAGSLVVLAVHPDGAADSVSAIRGELAGESLHFERVADGFRALGAVPLGAGDSVVVVRVVSEWVGGGDATDTVLAAIRVRPRVARRERLRVAPEFARPPDSLAERIRIESDIIKEIRQRAHETPRLWEAPFVRPSTGAVTSGFGVPRVFNGVVRSRHYGVDFGAERGAPVRSTNRGIVAFVADFYYSGTTVFIDHGAGLVTGYFHLSHTLVVPGDTVERGQLIGLVGSSGRVTRSHLHWFGAYGEITVDPLDLIALEKSLAWHQIEPATTGRTDAQR